MIGQVVNHYVIRSLIGQGGMGAVYLAEHSIIGYRAVIKILRRVFAEDEAMINRFVNEARAVNSIQHRNIIDILEVGRLADGLPYLLMEYLAGETLGQRLTRVGRLSLADALAVVGPTAAALQAAHDKGVIHRDLKPENIFLAREAGSEADRVVVLDFGVAKLRGDPSTQATGATLLGTPAYMSPEQCRGVGDIDARTDIYALGTILYQMLCGRVPFESAGYGEVLVKHLVEPPTPPRKLAPDLPVEVEAVILRSLAKDPLQRYASVAEVWAALTAAAPAVSTPASSPAVETPAPAPPAPAAPPPAPVAPLPASFTAPAPPAAAAPAPASSIFPTPPPAATPAPIPPAPAIAALVPAPAAPATPAPRAAEATAPPPVPQELPITAPSPIAQPASASASRPPPPSVHDLPTPVPSPTSRPSEEGAKESTKEGATFFSARAETPAPPPPVDPFQAIPTPPPVRKDPPATPLWKSITASQKRPPNTPSRPNPPPMMDWSDPSGLPGEKTPPPASARTGAPTGPMTGPIRIPPSPPAPEPFTPPPTMTRNTPLPQMRSNTPPAPIRIVVPPAPGRSPPPVPQRGGAGGSPYMASTMPLALLPAEIGGQPGSAADTALGAGGAATADALTSKVEPMLRRGMMLKAAAATLVLVTGAWIWSQRKPDVGGEAVAAPAKRAAAARAGTPPSERAPAAGEPAAASPSPAAPTATAAPTTAGSSPADEAAAKAAEPAEPAVAPSADPVSPAAQDLDLFPDQAGSEDAAFPGRAGAARGAGAGRGNKGYAKPGLRPAAAPRPRAAPVAPAKRAGKALIDKW